LAGWGDVAGQVAPLAALVEEVFAARRMKTLATIRRDGAPRLSEISGAFIRAGDFWLGLIPSAKERDLDRDPRCSVHCGSSTNDFSASARVSGRAMRAEPGAFTLLGMERTDGEPRFSLYRLDVSEVVVTRPDPESGLILMEWWTPERGPGRATRQGG
jgi:hypothetical protein